MKKKHIANILTTAWFVSAFPATAGTWASLTYEISDNQITITDCDTSASGELIIPNTIEDYPVTSIGYHAFYGCSELTSVTIPDSVTLIGPQAFLFCSALTSVLIPEGVTSLEASAFMSCTSLTNVTLPDSITNIGYYSFFNCSSLTSVTIGSGAISIGTKAFHACTSLTYFSISTDNLFYSCIDGVLFDKLISKLIHYPAKKPGSYAIPDGVNTIEENAFFLCSELTSISIPDSITSIASWAFEDCSGLTSIALPGSVTNIGAAAFSLCPNLTNISVSAENTYYASIAGIVFDKPMTTLLICPGGKAGSYTIPDCVSFIDNYAFENCSNITSLTIPDSVTSIGFSAFSCCSNMTNMALGNSITSIENKTFYKCNRLTNITVPERVMTIGSYAFSYCSSMTNVTLGNSITSIERYAFYKCSRLMDITIPENVMTIGASAFSYCGGMTNVILGVSVTNIGPWAFDNCSGLTSITIPSSATDISSCAYESCTNLTNALFEGDAPEQFGSSVFKYTAADFTVQFYEGASGFTTPTWEGYPCEMLAAPAGFDIWAAACPEGQQGDADAPDGDGIPNLIKYAAGLEPGTTYTSADLFTCSTETTSSNTVLTLNYYRDPAAIDANLYPVFSSSLADSATTWSAEGISTWDTGTITATGQSVWQATLPCESDSGFLRLSAELQ